jgi:hypothetical protein
VKRAGAGLAGAVLAVLLSPAVAWACPACATREGPGAATFALIAAMIAVPYAVSAVVLKIIRRLDADKES